MIRAIWKAFSSLFLCIFTEYLSFLWKLSVEFDISYSFCIYYNKYLSCKSKLKHFYTPFSNGLEKFVSAISDNRPKMNNVSFNRVIAP